MQEVIDTNFKAFGNKDIADGKNTFRILNIKKNEKMYIFVLSYDGDKQGEQVFFASNIGPLLKVLGCDESAKGVYILDFEKVMGKTFTATVFHEANKKDPNKVYQNMKDFDEVPF